MEQRHSAFEALKRRHEELLARPNEKLAAGNGLFDRYKYPVVTAEHVPLHWRYDLNPATNPYMMERIGVNATFNAGAMKWEDKYILMVRVEGYDRKSFFAIAESPNGVDNFRFREEPVTLPETDEPDVNVYDMRLTRHEDGWIYGIFCSERKDPHAPEGDLSSAVAAAGIVRTRDLRTWERLPDLRSASQQRNVVLHPEFVDGKYALYTRPQDGFIDAGRGGGIGWALVEDMTRAEVREETIIDCRQYHTIKELKNGEGPHPIRTSRGWLHMAHGVRGVCCGASVRAVPVPHGLAPPGTAHSRACGLLHGAAGRGAGGRRVERIVLQRVDCGRRRHGVYLLRLGGHAAARGHHVGGPAAGLLPAHAARRPALGLFGGGGEGAYRAEPGVPAGRNGRCVSRNMQKYDKTCNDIIKMQGRRCPPRFLTVLLTRLSGAALYFPSKKPVYS